MAAYDASFSALPGITLPPRHQFEDHAWHLYAILVADRNRREDLIRRLHRSHIGTAIHYPPLASHASLRPHITHVDSCPVSENLSGRLLSLPLFPDMTQSELERVIHVVQDVMRSE